MSKAVLLLPVSELLVEGRRTGPTIVVPFWSKTTGAAAESVDGTLVLWRRCSDTAWLRELPPATKAMAAEDENEEAPANQFAVAATDKKTIIQAVPHTVKEKYDSGIIAFVMCCKCDVESMQTSEQKIFGCAVTKIHKLLRQHPFIRQRHPKILQVATCYIF